jgi:hypothetical protein
MSNFLSLEHTLNLPQDAFLSKTLFLAWTVWGRGESLRKYCEIFKLGNGTPRLFRKQYLLAWWQQLSRIISKGWAPRTKDLTLYTLASRLQKQWARFSPYMVVCNSISYFTPSAKWPSCLDTLSFVFLLCHPLPPPTLSEHTLACFFFWPLSLLHYDLHTWASDSITQVELGIQEWVPRVRLWRVVGEAGGE